MGEEIKYLSRDVREIMEKWEKEKERPLNLYERVCKLGSIIFGNLAKSIKTEKSTMESLTWTGFRITIAEWWSGVLLLFILPTIIGFSAWLVLLLFGASLVSTLYLPIMGIISGLLLGIIFYLYPRNLADVKKTEAQSKAIETMMLLSFALYHRPSLRRALVFAADSSDGNLAEDIRRGLLDLDQKQEYDNVHHLLTVIAHNWREIDEGTRRALFDIIRSTSEKDEATRRQDVSRAPDRVLESSESMLNEKLRSLVMPTMIFLTFGSLAILGVIGLSPLFGMVGFGGFVDIKFFIIVSAILIAAFYAFTIVMGRQRPVTIPPPKISNVSGILPEGKANLFGKIVPTWFPALILAALFAMPGILHYAGVSSLAGVGSGLNTLWFVWSITVGAAAYGYLRVGSRAELREEARSQARDWGIVLNTLGSRMIDGIPMHAAISETARLMSDTGVGKQLRQVESTTEDFTVDTHQAIFGTDIAERIYNPLVTSLLDVVTTIKRSSEKAAGKACMMAADLLDTLQNVERRFKDKITDATNNLWMMGVILLPIVCALSVWIMEFMSDVSMMSSTAGAGLANIPFISQGMEASSLEILKLLMGLTALSLSMIVAKHIAIIRAGRDPIEFWNVVIPTVIITTVLFSTSYIAFGLLNIAT